MRTGLAKAKTIALAVAFAGFVVFCMVFAGHRLDPWHLVIGVPIGQALAASRTGTDDE